MPPWEVTGADFKLLWVSWQLVGGSFTLSPEVTPTEVGHACRPHYQLSSAVLTG